MSMKNIEIVAMSNLDGEFACRGTLASHHLRLKREGFETFQLNLAKKQRAAQSIVFACGQNLTAGDRSGAGH